MFTPAVERACVCACVHSMKQIKGSVNQFNWCFSESRERELIGRDWRCQDSETQKHRFTPLVPQLQPGLVIKSHTFEIAAGDHNSGAFSCSNLESS